MAAQFSVYIEAPQNEAGRIRAVAEEVFAEIHRLESLLSRFIEDSEIAQINRLRCGEEAVISPETFRCLSLALEAAAVTDGYFNTAYLSEPIDKIHQAFSLLKSPLRCRSEIEKLHLDLGGIGKGFALDYVREEFFLRYDYSRVLLDAGGSTLLAMDAPKDTDGWKVVLSLPDGERNVFLKNESISCSGKSVRGEHIFDVRRGIYLTESERIYVTSSSASLADAFSTAALTMPCDKKTNGTVMPF